MASIADPWWRSSRRRRWRGRRWYGHRWHGFDAATFAGTIHSIVQEAVDSAYAAVDSACERSSALGDWWDEPGEWSDDRAGYDARRWRDFPR